MSFLHSVVLDGTNNPVITLPEGTSGALIPLPAEAIARTFQQGDDLIIVLADGNRIAIADFFALEDPSLILRDPTTGDYTELRLGEDGNIIGQQPRSLSELAEMFDASAAEIAELQGAQAAEASASGTAWTMNTGVAAASVGVLAAIGAAVSGSDSDTDTSTGTTNTTGIGSAESEGVVVDGYISGARVFQDLDADGVFDAGEPSTTTNDQGRFTIALEQTGAASSQLVSVGGTDTSTNEPFTAVLTAPVDAEVISPLTTLVQSLVETQASGDNPISVAEANEQLASALGLSGSNLLELDPIAQLEISATAYVASSQVAAVISTTAAAAPEDERAAASEAAAAQLAEQLLATDQPDATAVLQDQDAVQQIIQAALVEATDIVPAEAEVTAEAIAEKVVDANARLDAAADGDAAQETIEAVQQVIQRDLVAAIADEDTEVGSIDLGARVEAALAALTGDQAGPEGGTQPEGNQTDGDQQGPDAGTPMSGQGTDGDETDGNQPDGNQTDGNQQGPGEVVPSTTGQGTEDDDDDDGDTDSPDPDAGAGGPEPVNSPGSVTIAGTVAEDQELRATVSDEDGLPDAADYNYQWQRNTGANGDFENIANATAQTYTLGDADAGQTVRVQVRYTDGQGTAETVTSDATAEVTNTNDAPAGDVTISAVPVEPGDANTTDTIFSFTIDGQRGNGLGLNANTDAIADVDGLPDDAAGYSYQWQRSDDQGNFSNIAGATDQSYTPVDADVNRNLRVHVRYRDGQGTDETLTSAVIEQIAMVGIQRIGGDDVDMLNGGDGNDVLEGGAGNDELSGGGGDDTLTGGAGADRLLGGDGTDTASYASSPAAVNVSLEDGSGTGGHAEGDTLNDIENLTGSGANDTLSGDDNANRLEGGEGDDTLTGLLGNDTLIGGAGNDTFSGGQGDDILNGGDGNDNLRAGVGNDALHGGAGNDTLFGGPDADRFLFMSEAEGDDRIEDFGTGADVLVFDADEWTGDDYDERLTDLLNATRLDDDGNLVIDRPDNRGSITLQGVGDDIALAEAEENATVIFDPDITV